MIAIDGPAGAGKSTVARMVAQKAGLSMLDTGAMYRAAGWAALRAGVNCEDELAVVRALEPIEIVLTNNMPNGVFVDGQEITGQIRSLEVGQAASQVSVFPQVRVALVAKQQNILLSGGWVLEGRDVTTVVAPDAKIKVFLTASIEERARRRWEELKLSGGDVPPLTEVVKDVVNRDHRDYTRADSPLMLAEDAWIIESFGVSPEEIADKIVARAHS